MATIYSIYCSDGKTINTTVTARASEVERWLNEINSMSGFTDEHPPESEFAVSGFTNEYPSNSEYAVSGFIDEYPPNSAYPHDSDEYPSDFPCPDDSDEHPHYSEYPSDFEDPFDPESDFIDPSDPHEFPYHSQSPSESVYPSDSEVVVVGLDVEWRPNRRSTDDHPVATLQLCVNDRCLIIQLRYLDFIPSSLRRFLSNPCYVFVGVGVDCDVDKLSNDYGLECSRTCDVRDIAVHEYPTMFSSNQPGLKELAYELIGIELEKPRHVTMSNWERADLTCAQVEYACLDAYASCRVGEILQYLQVLQS